VLGWSPDCATRTIAEGSGHRLDPGEAAEWTEGIQAALMLVARVRDSVARTVWTGGVDATREDEEFAPGSADDCNTTQKYVSAGAEVDRLSGAKVRMILPGKATSLALEVAARIVRLREIWYKARQSRLTGRTIVQTQGQ